MQTSEQAKIFLLICLDNTSSGIFPFSVVVESVVVCRFALYCYLIVNIRLEKELIADGLHPRLGPLFGKGLSFLIGV